MAKQNVDFTSVFEGHAHQMPYCRTKKQQFIKTLINNSKKQPKGQQKHQKPLKPMQITAKMVRKVARTHTSILAPGRPSDKNITRHAPTQLRLARTHGTHDTHETKTKTKRSRSPGYGGLPKGELAPLNLRYICIYIVKVDLFGYQLTPHRFDVPCSWS